MNTPLPLDLSAFEPFPNPAERSEVLAMSVDEWKQLQAAARPTLKQLLLADDGRVHLILPARGKARRHTLTLVEDADVHAGHESGA